MSDKHFGMAYCIKLLKGSGIQEGASKILSRGPHSVVFMSDILGWFPSHIEQLQAMLPAAENTEDSSMRAALVLLDRLKRTCQWSDMANTLAQSETQADKSTLEVEAKRTTDLFMVALAKAQEVFAELTSSASKIEICSKEDVKEAIEATVVMMQHALPAYKASNDLAGIQKVERNLWGIVAGACALATYLFVPSLILTIPSGMGTVEYAVKTGFLWKKQRKWQKTSKAIFRVLTVSHQIWLFLMLHLMRLNGLSTNTVAFKQFAKNMAETFEFDGVAVVGDWEDVDYVQSWVKERDRKSVV